MFQTHDSELLSPASRIYAQRLYVPSTSDAHGNGYIHDHELLKINSPVESTIVHVELYNLNVTQIGYALADQKISIFCVIHVL
jgi:hypothetical protein